jgi:ribonuclease J
MAYEGIVTLFLTLDQNTGELEGGPKIVAQGVRGFPSAGANGMGSSAQPDGELLKGAELAVSAAIAGASRQTYDDPSLLKEHVRLELKRFIQKETGGRPVIVPVIQQI